MDLWVERFRPKDYFELLSDDVIDAYMERKFFLVILKDLFEKGTNRLILTWIKSWDYFVFGKEVDKQKHEPKNRPPPSVGKDTPGSKKRKRVVEDDIAEKLLELDELNRPKLKVALISGPPGLGV